MLVLTILGIFFGYILNCGEYDEKDGRYAIALLGLVWCFVLLVGVMFYISSTSPIEKTIGEDKIGSNIIVTKQYESKGFRAFCIFPFNVKQEEYFIKAGNNLIDIRLSDVARLALGESSAKEKQIK